MRDFLTVIAILIILVLSAALAVPYFIDWEARRGQVESVLGEALGLPVHTGGAIELRLLPTPEIMLSDVSLGESGGARLTARSVSVEVAPMPLVKGEVRVIEAALDAPVLTVRVGEDGALAVPRPRSISAANVEIAIERLGISRGEIRVEDAAGSEIARIGGIEAEVVAASLAGPWRIEGEAQGVPLRIATGVREAGGDMRLKAVLGHAGESHLDIDGALKLTNEPGRGLLPRLAAAVRYTEPLPGAGPEPRQLALAGTVEGDVRSLTVRDLGLDLTHGEGGKDLALTGTATLTLAGRPSLQASLGGRRVDLDGLRERVGEAAFGLRASALLGRLPIGLDLSLETLVVEGEEFGPLTAALHRDGDVLALSRFDLGLPGETRIAGRGEGLVPSGERRDDLAGTGSVSLNIGQPLVLARALVRMGVPQSFAEALAGLPGLAASAELALDHGSIAARNITVKAGESEVGGAIRFLPADGNGGRPRYEAEVNARGVDITDLPRLDGLLALASGADIGLSLDARDLRIGQAGGDALGRLSALVEAGSQGIVVEYLNASGFGGAQIEAQGRIDAAGGRLGATIDAEHPQPLAQLAARFLPARAGAALTRAVADGGALHLTLEAGRVDAGAPLFVKASGKIGQTAVEMGLSLPPAAGVGAELDVSLTAGDGAQLLGQLGFDVLPLPDGEGGRLSLRARGPSLDDMAGRFSLAAAGASLSGEGTFSFSEARPLFAGRVTMTAGDLGRLAEVMTRPLPGGGALPLELQADATFGSHGLSLVNLSATAGGMPLQGRLTFGEDGRVEGAIRFERLALADVAALALGPLPIAPEGRAWSGERFAAAAPPVDGVLTLSVDSLSLSPRLALSDAALRLSLQPAGLAIDELAGELSGGRIEGNLSIRREGSLAVLSARGRFTAIPLSSLAGGALTGTLSGDFEVGTAGESPAQLMANLAGGATVSVANTSLPGLDPSALARMVSQALAAETLRPDLPAVTAALAAELDKGAWPVPQIAGPASLAGGILRFGPLTLPAQPGTAEGSLSGTLDLRSLAIDLRATVVTATSPKGWSGPPPQATVIWSGPLDAPARSLDAGGLANGLAAIGIVRELERIEAMEADARERAFHNRRLRAEREQRAREAERRAAEEARRREEEARRQQELQRQEDRRRLEELLREDSGQQGPLPAPADTPSRLLPQSQEGLAPRPLQLPAIHHLPELVPNGAQRPSMSPTGGGQDSGAARPSSRPPAGPPLDIRPTIR